MELYFREKTGATPVKFYEKTNLYSGGQKELDVTTCYSKLYESDVIIYHAFYLKMIGKMIWNAATIEHETVMRHYRRQILITSPIDTQSDYRDFKLKVDASPTSWQHKFEVMITSFRAMDGGMIEHAEASHQVNSVSPEGSVPFCEVEVDSKCLSCVATRFLDQSTGLCELCGSKISNCFACHTGTICDVCWNMQDAFGSTSCLTDLSLCLKPTHSRYGSFRCDSCEHPAPNSCKCGANWDLVDSSLGGGRKMCTCKIEDCKDYCLFE